MKKPLILAAAIAFVLTACSKAPTSTTPVAASSQSQKTLNSGEVHLLSAAGNGFYYQTFLPGEIEHRITSDRALVYAIDESAGTARPACHLPDCQHDSETCPANGGSQCYTDGDTVYVYTYNYNTDDQKGGFSLDAINADRTARTILADDLPKSWVSINALAADDTSLYLFVNDYTKSAFCSTLLSIDKSGTGSEIIYQWDTSSKVSLIGAADRQLYFAVPDTDTSSASITYTTGSLDLDTHTYTEQHNYKGDCFCLQDNSQGLIEQDTANGSIYEINSATGERVVIAANLPTASTGHRIEYILSRYSDGWLLHSRETSSDEVTPADDSSTVHDYFCRSGTATELPQRRFVYGKGVRGLSYLDIQNGRVLAVYQESAATVQDIGKDGTAGSQTAVWSTYGIISLDDFLSGSSDFVPLQFSF